MKLLKLALVGTLTIGATVAAFAESHIDEKAMNGAIKARQSHMQLYSFNLGLLGAMAKAELEYDSGAAQAAADNLAALSTLSHRGYWLPGTDSDSMEGTRALPALWEAGSEAQAKGMALAEAAAAMQAVAGTDLTALQGAMGAVGGACGSCHELYRKPNN